MYYRESMVLFVNDINSQGSSPIILRRICLEEWPGNEVSMLLSYQVEVVEWVVVEWGK